MQLNSGVRRSTRSSAITASPLATLARDAYWSFIDAADYVWKAPELIEKLEERELDVLSEIENPDHSESRWKLESRKLYRMFPFLMATGNLFTILALFEVHTLLLAVELSRVQGVPFDSSRCSGIGDLLKHLRSLGIRTAELPLWPQVSAAIKVRNCLAHLSGLLTHSREDEEIRRIVRSEDYRIREHRGKTPDDPDLRIVSTSFGERLEVTNHYAWLTTVYLRDYITGVFEQAMAIEAKGSAV